jgi:hypothetical protein
MMTFSCFSSGQLRPVDLYVGNNVSENKTTSTFRVDKIIYKFFVTCSNDRR